MFLSSSNNHSNVTSKNLRVNNVQANSGKVIAPCLTINCVAGFISIGHMEIDAAIHV